MYVEVELSFWIAKFNSVDIRTISIYPHFVRHIPAYVKKTRR